jgi:excisionase family DNA binding protein
MPKNREIMTVNEVAEYLGIHELTVQRHAREGKIPAFKIRNEWRFDRKHIQKWLKERSSSRLAENNGLFIRGKGYAD